MSETKKTILMIEDDVFLSNLYRDKFEKEGFSFLSATSGIEGMNKIINEKPDIVLLDILLPLKSGFDILEEINKDESLSKIPIIVLSNLRQETDIEEGRRMGAKDYFIKSETNFNDLLDSIKKNL